MNDKWSVYAHINELNGKMYIGITGQKPERRWGYNGDGYKYCPKFYHAIQKYGWNNLKHVVLITNISEVEACEIEMHLIKEFDTIANGYNQESGGIGGSRSEETKKKIREARAKQVITPEAIEKTAAAHRGTKHNESTIKLMRESARDRFRAVECVETGEYFECITDAAKAKNVSVVSVYRSCERFEQQVSTRNRGLHWKFAS